MGLKKHNKNEGTSKALKQYIEQTNEIRTLTTPQIRHITGADSYRRQLMENFYRIGVLAKDNVEILNQYYFPILNSQSHLNSEIVEEMREFSDALIDAYNLHNMDIPLVYKQAVRLVEEADAIDDDETRILALDGLVMAAYLMISISARLVPVNHICLKYFDVGLKAAERLLEYLEPEKFATLSTEMKELVIINARYIRVVSEIDEVPDTPERRELNLNRMKNAIALADNPFYRDQLPDYDWELHKFRTYEYIACFTEVNNQKEYNQEQLKYIYDCTKKMVEMAKSKDYEYMPSQPIQILDLLLSRNGYLAGEIDLEQYKSHLEALIFQDFRESPSDNVPLLMLIAPLEYMCVLDPDNLSATEVSCLGYFYNKLVGYMHQTPKKDYMTFLLGCLSYILKHFVEIPDIMDFETMCLSLIAAFHPTTYVHTLSVAAFSKVLTRYLLEREPELFVGMEGYDKVEDVKSHFAEIEDYAYHAAICHDFGKLMIADTILTYGRNLLDDEMGFIQSHPAIGAYLLAKQKSTAKYADVALGHHKWYDDIHGYPEDFSLEKSPYKTIISIIACADCLDASTDFVGRSYKQGKTTDEYIEELKEGSGTEYAPYMVELLSDPEIRNKLEQTLQMEREENYKKAYFVLKKYA